MIESRSRVARCFSLTKLRSEELPEFQEKLAEKFEKLRERRERREKGETDVDGTLASSERGSTLLQAAVFSFTACNSRIPGTVVG